MSQASHLNPRDPDDLQDLRSELEFFARLNSGLFGPGAIVYEEDDDTEPTVRYLVPSKTNRSLSRVLNRAAFRDKRVDKKKILGRIRAIAPGREVVILWIKDRRIYQSFCGPVRDAPPEIADLFPLPDSHPKRL